MAHKLSLSQARAAHPHRMAVDVGQGCRETRDLRCGRAKWHVARRSAQGGPPDRALRCRLNSPRRMLRAICKWRQGQGGRGRPGHRRARAAGAGCSTRRRLAGHPPCRRRCGACRRHGSAQLAATGEARHGRLHPAPRSAGVGNGRRPPLSEEVLRGQGCGCGQPTRPSSGGGGMLMSRRRHVI